MKVITNEKLIKRNSRLGQVATIAGLLVLVGGMFISFRYPNLLGLAWVALLVGFALSANRALLWKSLGKASLVLMS